MKRGAESGFSLIEAVIALMIATMALSFIGTAGYSLRFASERASSTIDGPDDRLALRRLLGGLLNEAVNVSGDSRSLVLDPEHETRGTLRILEGGEKGWQLIFERPQTVSYPLPSLLFESEQPLKFQYRAHGPDGVKLSDTASSETDVLTLVEARNRIVVRIPLRRGISPGCLLRVGPGEARKCLP